MICITVWTFDFCTNYWPRWYQAKSNILEDHGPPCSLYRAYNKDDKGFSEGDFQSAGDSPAFLHNIPNGLRSDDCRCQIQVPAATGISAT